MPSTGSLLTVYAALFSPLNDPFPKLMLDETLTVLAADEAAQAAGLRERMQLRPLLPDGEWERHMSNLRRTPESRAQILHTPQNRALYSLHADAPFPFLYLEYAYTRRHALIRAALYPSRRAYLLATAETEDGARSCFDELRRVRPSRVYAFQPLAEAEDASEDAAIMQARLAAAAAAAQCLDIAAGRPSFSLFCLSRVLEYYCAEVLRDLYFIDSEVLLSFEGERPLYARLEPEPFFLLLSALFSVLGALSTKRRIRVRAEVCGGNPALTFTTACALMAGLPDSCPDLQALFPAAPQKRFALTLADYIIGYSGYEVRLFGDPQEGTLSVTLYLMEERREREFKSPREELELMRSATAAARGFFALVPNGTRDEAAP